MLALVAGSDTTSTTLANVVFNLITNPKVFASLRAEIDSLEHNETSVVVLDGEQPLGDLKYLNAVINETLRVTPVLPCGGQRTSKAPVVIGDK
jgi:cytochrome P450